MAVITELSHSVIEEALEQYDVGQLIRFKPASQGIENTNYFISTRKSNGNQNLTIECVFTLVEELGGDEKARSTMVEILERCEDLGLPVPKLIRTRNGEFEGQVLNKPVLLCSMLSGSHVGEPAREQCAAIGRFLARFHRATLPLKDRVNPYIRDIKWLSTRREQVEEKVSSDQRFLLRHTFEIVQSLLQRNDVNALPKAVIHADLFRDNALFDTRGLTGVVDFYHAGVGYQIYDLAVAINDWCVYDGAVDEERALALLTAYNNIRPLTLGEENFLSHFLLYAALSFWLSRLIVSVREDLPPDYPIKDPVEFEHLVDRHLRRPFRLVESVSTLPSFT